MTSSEATETRRLLVLAIQTLAGPSAGGRLVEFAQEEQTSFHLVVPVTKPDYGMTWTWAQARNDAQVRLDLMCEFAGAAGLEVTGEVGATEPRDAVRAAIETSDQPFDGLVIIYRSNWRKWLRGPDRTAIEELLGMPVFEVEADPPMRNTKIVDAEELRAVFYEAAERMPNPPE